MERMFVGLEVRIVLFFSGDVKEIENKFLEFCEVS